MSITINNIQKRLEETKSPALYGLAAFGIGAILVIAGDAIVFIGGVAIFLGIGSLLYSVLQLLKQG